MTRLKIWDSFIIKPNIEEVMTTYQREILEELKWVDDKTHKLKKLLNSKERVNIVITEAIAINNQYTQLLGLLETLVDRAITNEIIEFNEKEDYGN